MNHETMIMGEIIINPNSQCSKIVSNHFTISKTPRNGLLDWLDTLEILGAYAKKIQGIVLIIETGIPSTKTTKVAFGWSSKLVKSLEFLVEMKSSTQLLYRLQHQQNQAGCKFKPSKIIPPSPSITHWWRRMFQANLSGYVNHNSSMFVCTTMSQVIFVCSIYFSTVLNVNMYAIYICEYKHHTSSWSKPLTICNFQPASSHHAII